jgi:hypothetical protein
MRKLNHSLPKKITQKKEKKISKRIQKYNKIKPIKTRKEAMMLACE